MLDDTASRFSIGILLFIGWEILAIMTIVNVVMKARSAAGAWGWTMAMLAFPFVAVPLYWVLGRQQFQGYREQLQIAQEQNEGVFDRLIETLDPHFAQLNEEEKRYGGVLERLSERRWTDGNEVCLLIEC